MVIEALPYVDQTRSGLHELASQPEISWGSSAYEVVRDPRFERALDTVHRWHDNVIVPPEGISETDLGHVRGMEDILLEILVTAPNLSRQIIPGDVALMIRVHDMAEIIVGDVPCSVDDPATKRRKERGEPLAAVMMTRNLGDPARSHLRASHVRYEKRASTDREALLTKWIDVMQGNRFALAHNLYETILDPPAQQKHVTDRIKDMIKWTGRLATSLDDQEARLDVYEIAGKEMRRFVEHGFGQFVLDGFLSSVASQRQNRPLQNTT
jgi:hypothetical protein